MPFNHKAINNAFMDNAAKGKFAIIDPNYDIRFIEAAGVENGEFYWKCLGVHHLLPEENSGKHNVYIEALDEQGRRIKSPFAWAGWDWEGRRPNERADPVPLDKPDSETGGDIALYFGQKISLWIRGISRDANDKSDLINNLHTAHHDEPLPDGRLLNTVGHHSFYVVFQRTRKIAKPIPVPESEPVSVMDSETVEVLRAGLMLVGDTVDRLLDILK